MNPLVHSLVKDALNPFADIIDHEGVDETAELGNPHPVKSLGAKQDR